MSLSLKDCPDGLDRSGASQASPGRFACPEMAAMPAGSFMMGGDKNLEDAGADETPRREVIIAKPFAIGKYAVTQKEWELAMESNPSRFKGHDRPVEMVNFDDVQIFIEKLNARTGQNYRLPSEAEWEYAARAGSNTAYSFGGDTGQLGQYAWFEGNSGGETHPVGQLKPNGFGLYDMHGNVWEWTGDCWHDDYNGAPPDGSAWMAGDCQKHVLRGGAWNYPPRNLRSASRGQTATGIRSHCNGFRLARTL